MEQPLRLDNATGVLAGTRADQCMAAIAATDKHMIFHAFCPGSNSVRSAFDAFANRVCGMFDPFCSVMGSIVNLVTHIFLRSRN